MFESIFTPEEQSLLKQARALLKAKAKTRKAIFTEPGMVKDYLRFDYGVRESVREEFKILYMDNRHRLISDEILFMGTIDASPVYPRVVVQRALQLNSAAVILAHNHPSGLADPSRADRAITERLQQALMLIDVRILDHFVVGDEEVVSFAERGWI